MNGITDGSKRNLLVIKASAGSGKTYNLALQYIKHLLFTTSEDGKLIPRRGRDDARIVNAHRLLLAITFTNKATDEMKKRIVKELYRLSQPGADSDYLDGFMSESGLDEATVRNLAQQALNELLFDYSYFNVSTIDSFFQSILRNFARELDRDFNYDIQLEEKYAVRVALHNFLLSLGRGKSAQVDDWVKEYMRHMTHGDADKSRWKFFDDGGELLSFANQINSEMFRAKMPEIRDYLGQVDENGDFQSDFSRIRAFKKHIHAVAKQRQQAVEAALEELRDTLLPLSDRLSGNRSLGPWMKKGGNTPLSKSLKGADEQVIIKQFKGGSPGEATVDQVLRLVTAFFHDSLVADFFKKMEDNLGLLGLLAMIDLFLERYRRETNSILIGDTNELIGTVLESGSDFVYERVGTSIAHFMIDEFQDTSTKQYENFRGLLQESLANGHFNMLIGDAKQSIYRFRNADPTVFRERVGKDFDHDIYQPATQEGKPKSTNYRSSPNIIEFNNRLFGYAGTCYPGVPAVEKSYQDVRQGLPPGIHDKKVPGYVRLLMGNYGRLLDDEFIQHAVDSEQVAIDDSGAVDVLDILPAYLLQLHQRYDWGRIGILVNSNEQGKRIVERVLDYNRRTTGEHINIISGESLLLNNSSVVRRIIALLRFIDISQIGASEEDADDIDRDIIDKNVEQVNRKRMSDQRLYAAMSRFVQAISAHPDGSSLENGQMLEASFNEFGNGWSDDKVDVNASRQATNAIVERLLPSGDELTTLVSIVENIIAYFKSDCVDGADVDREAAFLLAFQDTVMQFAALRNGGSVREFLKFWDEKKDKLTVSTSATNDAVNIMTIHKAKGLEFDCVVIPFANWEINDNSKESEYWMPRDVLIDVMQSMAPDAPAASCEIVPPLARVKKGPLVEAYELGLLHDRASGFVAEQRSAVIIDNLNKTYVAMTRPRTELHLFADGDRNNDLKPLLQDFIDSSGIMVPIVGRDAQPIGWYEYGEISDRQLIDSKRQEEESDVIRQPLERYLVNSIPSSIRVKVENASSAHIEAGIRLHSLMSRIHDRNDVDWAINHCLKHGINTRDADDPCGIDNVNAHVRGPILDSNSQVSVWFDPANRVYSERTITSASDSLWSVDGIENLRPDRIICRPDGTMLVIDYKSGQRDDKRYLRQLAQYIAKLRLIFPDNPIAGRIWYIAQDLILDEHGHEIDLR